MNVTRRAALGGGLAATAWAIGPARGEPAAPRADGPLLLEAGPARLALSPAPAEPAESYAYSGATPGPLLRLKKGEAVNVRLINKLAEPTALSFPGLRTANANAGIGGLTETRLAPGGGVDIRFVPPDSGFNLYLPHAGATDAGQQGRGMFGPIVVEEASKPDIDLDFVVVLSDWSADERGQINNDFSDPVFARGSGRKGGLIFANGVAAPLRTAARPGTRVRLRLGNAATSRVATIGVEGAKSLIIAVDGQPSEPFEPLGAQFPMGPGARFELVFDMPREAGGSAGLTLKADDGEADKPFVAITAEGEPVPIRSDHPRLIANPLLPAEIQLEAARRFNWAISGGGSAPFAVNGATFIDWAPKPAVVIPRGAPAVFGLANRTAVVQAMRLSGHVARLLHSMDDGWEPYWRDTILIQPGRAAHIAFLADNPGKWPLESTIPEHRAAGVGTWFLVA